MQAILNRSIVWEGTPAQERQLLSKEMGPARNVVALTPSTLSTDKLLSIWSTSSFAVRKLA